MGPIYDTDLCRTNESQIDHVLISFFFFTYLGLDIL